MSFLPGTMTQPEALGIASFMSSAAKKGKFFHDHEKMTNLYRTREFKITPSAESKVPFLIDGYPEPCSKVHVKVHNRGMRVMCPLLLPDGSYVETPIPPEEGGGGGKRSSGLLAKLRKSRAS